ncbi:hypothetical protein Lesp02_23160 [Lentzea sp. NBRC 105346]|uniref:hypothetical protein n=1 Tax=Lentzea sp. NBRC 105346 TaxID=3032205 RepID=UPI0024A1862A|nr:hypothetical protein [Lentzea sp. NBRC 105346]GLZ30126.1 hypothetical protein Lesp02_23160 [Lentzea sp. NBRC 105346]
MSGNGKCWVLTGVYGLLAAANLLLMAAEPTAWQGVFAVALLGAAVWFGLRGTRRVAS